VGHQRAFEVHRTYPLAAGLDDVFRTVTDGHESFAVDRADVAGAQPIVMKSLGVVHAEIGTGDPRPPYLELADGLAVSGQDRAVVARDADLDAGDDATGLDAVLNLDVRGSARRRDRDRGQGAGLGHPQPGSR